ncbi:MAG: hypothetical protein Ct9H300mP21_06400 [Pseudomonadota bacterium]|nr:MAG: hypothetical protein Ct9H300mP21_06400 [Pseudomonadota bacterium]
MESASLILTGKGKKRQEWNPVLMKSNYFERCNWSEWKPACSNLENRNEFIVGFNPELYEEVFG